MNISHLSHAVVTVAAADDVARFLDSIIATRPEKDRAGWQQVADALFAISNDTDCIVTQEDLDA